VEGLDGLLLSPRAYREGDNFECCQSCNSGMQPFFFGDVIGVAATDEIVAQMYNEHFEQETFKSDVAKADQYLLQ